MAEKLGAVHAIDQLEDWGAAKGARDAIQKSFKFADFKVAWAFMSACALKAEQMDHHPEWFNVYSRVDVTLTTHDANGVTELDIKLAKYMDEIAIKLAA
ncbi:MAG: 4a-hydroxytetrahydrobiopterin dehydratase [Henriciella sp.]